MFQQAAYELLVTERDYVGDLRVMSEVTCFVCSIFVFVFCWLNLLENYLSPSFTSRFFTNLSLTKVFCDLTILRLCFRILMTLSKWTRLVHLFFFLSFSFFLFLLDLISFREVFSWWTRNMSEFARKPNDEGDWRCFCPLSTSFLSLLMLFGNECPTQASLINPTLGCLL